MDGAEVRVLEEMHHEGFGGLLEGLYGLALPAEGLAVDWEEGEADFADLELSVWGMVRCSKSVGGGGVQDGKREV